MSSITRLCDAAATSCIDTVVIRPAAARARKRRPGTFGDFGSGWGTIFKLDSSGHETILYAFTGGADGENPFAGLIMDAAGNLYGSTGYGGPYDAGTLFKFAIASTPEPNTLWLLGSGILGLILAILRKAG